MNPSSSPSYGRPCLLHQAGGPVRSFTRLSLPVLCIVGFSTIAQEPLVLEPQSGSHSTARSSSPFASFSTDVAPTPNEHSAPDATPHAAAPATAPGGRPNFLPPPAPHRANPAQEQQQPAGTPDTIITQVEVPIPPQTAEPLAIGIPSASRAGGPVGDAAFLRETSPAPTPRQATLAPSASAPPSTYAAPPAPSAQTVAAANRREEAVLPREAIPSTIDESGGDASVPTVVYDKGQQALPQPAIPAAPAPPPPPDFGQLLKQRRYSEIEPVAIDTADSKLASALGWSRYQDGRTDLAYSWFEKAIQWDENNYEAAYGMALSLFKMGRYAQAEEIARWRVAEYPKMKKILGDITARGAVTEFQAKNYKQSREILLSIKSNRSLSREEEIMLAWNEFHLGNMGTARVTFERLYRARPDRFSAEGVYATYARSRNWSGLEELARSRKGPLEALYQQHVSQKYYDYGLYRKAYAEAPASHPALENISTPVVGGAVEGRFRSGTAGTSQLSEYNAKVGGTIYVNDVGRLDVNVNFSDLDSGALVPDTLIGQAPVNAGSAYKHNPVTAYHSLIDARIRYEHEGLLTPWVELGITPIHAALDPTFVGSLGLKKTEDWGAWQAELFRDPVKDSLLSYTGIRDPYTGRNWGRVTETGVRFSLYTALEDDWGFYGAASAGIRAGHDVQDNSHAGVTVALNKALHYQWFESFTLGPSLGVEFYDKNLSQFTYGQGGYFSPSYLVQGMISARFLTPQGGSSLLRGGAGLGIQSNHQDSVPLFPNDPDGRWFSASSKTGVAFSVNFEAMYQLSEQWTMGGGISLNLAPDYNDFSARLTLQYFFEPRKGLFVQDFLTF